MTATAIAEARLALDAAKAAARPVKRSFTLSGHKTSISMEAAFWDALKSAAAAEGLSTAALVGQIDRARGEAGLSGAVRVWVLAYWRSKAPEPQAVPEGGMPAVPPLQG